MISGKDVHGLMESRKADPVIKRSKKISTPACQLRALDERIIVLPDDREAMTKGGIVLPENAQKRSTSGVVAAVGPGKLLNDGSRAHLHLTPGDRIHYISYGAHEVPCGEEKFVCIKPEDVLAVVAE